MSPVLDVLDAAVAALATIDVAALPAADAMAVAAAARRVDAAATGLEFATLRQLVDRYPGQEPRAGAQFEVSAAYGWSARSAGSTAGWRG